MRIKYKKSILVIGGVLFMGDWKKYLEGNYDENGNLIARYKQRKDDE